MELDGRFYFDDDNDDDDGCGDSSADHFATLEKNARNKPKKLKSHFHLFAAVFEFSDKTTTH